MSLELDTDLTTETGVISAATVGGVTNQLADKFSSNIVASDLSDDAGLRKEQIADNCSISTVSLTLLPNSVSSGTFDGTQTHTISTSSYALCGIFEVVADSSQKVWLTSIIMNCGTVVASSGSYPQIEVRKNGTAISGASFVFDTSDGRYYLQRTDPTLNPLDTLVSGDVLSFYLKKSSSGNPTVTYIYATVTLKYELVR
jgi:hypothetical protein